MAESPTIPMSNRKYAELAAQQTRLHAQKMESMEVTKAILNNQIRQYEAELKELGNREKTLREQYQLMKEEYETYENLFKRELVGKTEFLVSSGSSFRFRNTLIRFPFVVFRWGRS